MLCFVERQGEGDENQTDVVYVSVWVTLLPELDYIRSR